jgi:tetratricopeptide (TPR) repeat protein
MQPKARVQMLDGKSRWLALTVVTWLVIAFWGICPVPAQGTLKLTLPRRSHLTVVQRLNRDGVKAVQQHDYSRAAVLFLKAYLYDPSDPFTLNNLGFISELQGQLDHAVRFYTLAAEQGCDADIDMSNVKGLEGKPLLAALGESREAPMHVNLVNVSAVHLLSEDRKAEAIAVLQNGLTLNPQDPFTLNNLGVANEANGDYRSALKYYTAAAASRSTQVVVITQDRSWEGKPVSEMAAANAARLQEQLQGTGSAQAQATALSLQGVLSENQNDWTTARQDFLKAYSLDPQNAFALNNRGYVAERDGDLESADYFYRKALLANDANRRVGVATNQSAKGDTLSHVTSGSIEKVGDALETYSQERRRQTGPVELTPRDNVPQGSSTAPQQSSPSTNAAPALPSYTPQNHE